MNMAMPTIAEVLDSIHAYTDGTRYSLTPGTRGASIITKTGSTYSVDVIDGSGGVIPHICLWNEMRAIAFENISELRGWLRYDHTLAHTKQG